LIQTSGGAGETKNCVREIRSAVANWAVRSFGERNSTEAAGAAAFCLRSAAFAEEMKFHRVLQPATRINRENRLDVEFCALVGTPHVALCHSSLLD